MGNRSRSILHVDMNAFFASCHRAAQPQRYPEGVPIAVAGSVQERRGIILTASYEARRAGVRTGMFVREATARCSGLVLIPPDHQLYAAYSRRVMEILGRFSPLVEPFSIDEAWVDLTGCPEGTPLEAVRKIQGTIKKELGLPCSAGLSGNKLLAKLASELQKPEGLTVLPIRAVPEVIWPLEAGKLLGVGPKTGAALARLGIFTIGDLAKTPPDFLEKRFGQPGRHLHEGANGRDDSPVRGGTAAPKSVGHSLTLPQDLETMGGMSRVLLALAEKVARRMRLAGVSGRTVTVTWRTAEFLTFSRAVTLPGLTQLEREIHRAALGVLEGQGLEGVRVRLLGVSVSGLVGAGRAYSQLTFWDGAWGRQKGGLLSLAMDGLKEKYGEGIIRWGRGL